MIFHNTLYPIHNSHFLCYTFFVDFDGFLKKMRSTNPLFLNSPLILQTAIWPITRPLLWFFVHLKVLGLENIKDLPKGVIFASNHTSELDVIMIPASLPFLSRFMPMFYVSRPRAFYENSGWRQILYGGLVFKLWGAHSAISGYKDYGVSLSNHIHIIQRRHSLIIYPEGHKTLDGKVMINEARGGVAFLAEKTGLPIVPVCLNGLFKITFSDFIFRRRYVTITFGKPIYDKNLFENLEVNQGENRYKIASKKVLEKVAGLVKDLNSPVSNEYPAFSGDKV